MLSEASLPTMPRPEPEVKRPPAPKFASEVAAERRAAAQMAPIIEVPAPAPVMPSVFDDEFFRTPVAPQEEPMSGREPVRMEAAPVPMAAQARESYGMGTGRTPDASYVPTAAAPFRAAAAPMPQVTTPVSPAAGSIPQVAGPALQASAAMPQGVLPAGTVSAAGMRRSDSGVQRTAEAPFAEQPAMRAEEPDELDIPAFLRRGNL
jgi:hypothetical protein